MYFKETQIIVKSINFHDSTQINFLTHPTHIIYGLSHDDYLNWSLKNLRESSFNLSDNSDKGFSEKCLEFDVDKYFSF